MSAPVLACFAVPQEARPFQKLMRGRADVHVVITGMGTRNAERTAREALDRLRPRFVFTCGFAGALDPGLEIGDVLFESETVLAPFVARLQSLGAKPAKFFCAERIATTRAEKSTLRASTGADAVEMESRVISEICRAKGIECVTLRVISDTAREDLPLDFNALTTPELELNAGRLAVAILKAPHKIPALMRLGTNSARAARQLARVLSALI